MTVAESLQFYFKHRQDHPGRSVAQLLVETYKRTGKTVKDGTVVCCLGCLQWHGRHWDAQVLDLRS